MFDGAFSEDHGCKTQRFSGCICDYEHQKDSTLKSQCLLKAYLTEINYALDFLRAENLSLKRKLLLPFLLAPVLPQAHCWKMSGHPGICWVQPHISGFLPLCIIYLFLFLNDLSRAEIVIGSLLPPCWSQGGKHLYSLSFLADFFLKGASLGGGGCFNFPMEGICTVYTFNCLPTCTLCPWLKSWNWLSCFCVKPSFQLVFVATISN